MTVIAHIGHHPALAWRVAEGGNVDRALERSPGLEERLINEMGVDEEGRPYIQPDQERINAVLRKLAAGLFYLKYEEAPGLEAFHPISLYNFESPPDIVIDLSWKFQHIEPMDVVQWSIFYYGFCNIPDDENFTYCNINFYNSVFGMVACPYKSIK